MMKASWDSRDSTSARLRALLRGADPGVISPPLAMLPANGVVVSALVLFARQIEFRKRQCSRRTALSGQAQFPVAAVQPTRDGGWVGVCVCVEGGGGCNVGRTRHTTRCAVEL